MGPHRAVPGGDSAASIIKSGMTRYGAERRLNAYLKLSA
jgi:hypothetical protein